MADVELRSDQPAHEAGSGAMPLLTWRATPEAIKSRHWVARVLITLATVAVAALLGC